MLVVVDISTESDDKKSSIHWLSGPSSSTSSSESSTAPTSPPVEADWRDQSVVHLVEDIIIRVCGFTSRIFRFGENIRMAQDLLRPSTFFKRGDWSMRSFKTLCLLLLLLISTVFVSTVGIGLENVFFGTLTAGDEFVVHAAWSCSQWL